MSGSNKKLALVPRVVLDPWEQHGLSTTRGTDKWPTLFGAFFAIQRWVGVPAVAIVLLLGDARAARSQVGHKVEAAGAAATAKSVADDSSEGPVPTLKLAGRVQDRKPILGRQDDEHEASAYAEALAAATNTSANAFARVARRDVSYAQVWEEPEKYRGAVIHVEGRLRRLRVFDAPAFIGESQAIKKIYEGWVFEPEIYGANPKCVLFTEALRGIDAMEELDERVAFDGYFFKRYRYKAGDGWRDAPLFMAHSLNRLPLPVRAKAAGAASASPDLATAFISVLVTTAIAVGAIAWWYRRGDSRIRAHLAKAASCTFAEQEKLFEEERETKSQ